MIHLCFVELLYKSYRKIKKDKYNQRKEREKVKGRNVSQTKGIRKANLTKQQEVSTCNFRRPIQCKQRERIRNIKFEWA